MPAPYSRTPKGPGKSRETWPTVQLTPHVPKPHVEVTPVHLTVGDDGEETVNDEENNETMKLLETPPKKRRGKDLGQDIG